MLAIFSYGFSTAEENFKNANVNLNTLSNYEMLLEQAERSKYINAEEATLLAEWRQNPANWGQ
jgi:orotate phosphoribosyltransferase